MSDSIRWLTIKKSGKQTVGELVCDSREEAYWRTLGGRMELEEVEVGPIVGFPPKSTGPTVESVYGRPLSEIKPPTGYCFVYENGKPVFRNPLYGDAYMSITGHYVALRSSSYEWEGWPRLIVRKVPDVTVESVYGKPLAEIKPPTGYVFVIEDGKPAFRRPRQGEFLMPFSENSAPLMVQSRSFDECRLILQKDPNFTVESIYGKTLDYIKPPDGYFFVMEDGKPAFRPVRVGEFVIGANGLKVHQVEDTKSWLGEPRLIVRKAEVVRYIEDPNGPYWYQDWNSGMQPWPATSPRDSRHKYYRVEVEG